MPWRTVRMSGRRGNIARFEETIPWYLAGNVQPANVLGAWQPKGAMTYAQSKISLHNPSASNLLVDGAAYPTWTPSVGWTFAGASSQYLTIASAIATAVPITMICRFAHANVTDTDALMSICDSAETNYFYLMPAGAVAGDPIQFSSWQAGVGGTATSLSGYIASTWFTAAGVTGATNARAVYINGGSKGTNATDKTPDGLDTTYIGVYTEGATKGGYYTGNIAACAFYNIALSDAQVLAIHNAMMEI